MCAEKSPPPMYKEKDPLIEDNQMRRICSKSVVSWLLATILVALFVVLCIEFLYPAIEPKLEPEFETEIDHLNIYEGKPVETKAFTPKPRSQAKDKEKKAEPKTKAEPLQLDFIINPLDLCATTNPPSSTAYQQDPEVKLLMMVTSATSHFEHRNAIRKTWGSVAQKQQGSMRLGFVLGKTSNQTEEELIHRESEEFGDIIQGNFDDTYNNLTLKSIAMLKWVACHCPYAKFFLKADDDTFVNLGKISSLLAKEPFTSLDKFISGFVHQGAQPFRGPDEKYYIPEENYPEEEYPPYASGSAYVLTGPTAVDLFDVCQWIKPMLPMEDVFVTGLCSQDAGVPLIHEPLFRYNDPPKPASWDAFSQLASVHNVTPEEMKTVWNQMGMSPLDHLYQQETEITFAVSLRKK